LSANEAAAALGVSLATLYAYVSRGLVRSEPESAGSRRRRYRAEDVAALRQRKAERRDPAKVAEAALHFGMPVLDSAISVIVADRLYYRGREATRLAIECTIEDVAALLWGAAAADEAGRGRAEEPFADDVLELSAATWKSLARVAAGMPPLERLQLILPAAAAADSSAFDLRPAAMRRTGARILRILAAGVAGGTPDDRPVARSLARAWKHSSTAVAEHLDAAMILCADHDLNVSTFTARCAASAGSSPYGVVVAGLAALRGFRHGGMTERVEALFDEAATPKAARGVLEARLRRGEGLPGFGHPLYRGPDPRAALLLDRAIRRRNSPATAVVRALVEAARDLTAEAPNIDFGLVALARVVGLPPGAPLQLLALGRTVGWIAHAIEQVADGRLIRPRARYVGAPPQS
jgi:citrate synthase